MSRKDRLWILFYLFDSVNNYIFLIFVSKQRKTVVFKIFFYMNSMSN